MQPKLTNKFLISIIGLAGLFFVLPGFASAAVLNSESAISPVLDLLFPGVALDRLEWQATTDANDAVGVDIRGGDVASPDGSWTGWVHLATTTGGATPTIANRALLISASVNGKQYLQYRVNLETSATSSQPSLDRLDVYAYRGDFTSSAYNSLTFVNGLEKISWTAALPGGAQAVFQVRSSINNITWTPWCGPDNGLFGTYSSANCNSASVFTLSNGSQPIDADLYMDNNDLYLQYRAFLAADQNDLGNLPELSQVIVDYKNEPYAGTSTTPVEDGGARLFHYDNLTWKATTTAGVNGVYCKIRVGDDNTPDDGTGNWTAWLDVASTTPGAGSTTIGDLRSLSTMLDGHRYYQLEIKLETADTNNFPALDWAQVNTYTYNPGWFISNWYNTQDPSAEMGSITWLENSSSTDTSPYTVSIQARTASSSNNSPVFVDTLSTDWFGPNGTSTSYFTATNTAQSCVSNQLDATTTSAYCPVGDGNYLSAGGNDQFMQYKVYLDTDGFNAPTFRSLTMGYGINVAPTFINTTANSTTTGQAVRQWKEADMDKANDLAMLVNPNVDMTGKSLITFALYDGDTLGINAQGSSTARLPGQARLSLQYCDRADGNCTLLSDWKIAATSSYNIYDVAGALIHDGLNTNPGFSNGTTTVAIGDASSTPAEDYHLLFDPKQEADLQNKYLANFHFRVVADDAEGANRYGYLDSGTSILDTKLPTITNFKINASTQLGAQPATYYATTIDDSATGTELLMRDSLDAGFADNPTWHTYVATSTKFLAAATSTVYVQLKDAYGNVYVGQITPPAPPEGLMLADISNPVDESYKLFVSWKKIFDPVHFNRYVIWRATSTTVCGDIYTDTACYEALEFTEHLSEPIYTNNFFTDADLASSTTYYYKVTMEDNDGNISRYLDVIHDNPDGQGGTDKTPPTLSSAQVTATSTQSATIQWETDELSKSMVYFLPQVDYETNVANVETDLFLGAKRVGLNGFTQNSATIFGPHIVTLNKLIPNTTYYYKLISEDPSGNVGQLLEQFDAQTGSTTPLIFQTKNGPEISSTIQVKSITNTSATISWTTTLPSDSSVIYSTSTDSINQLVAPVETKGSLTQVTEHEVSLTGLIPNTPYLYYVASANTDGNQAIDKNIPDEGPFAGETLYFSFTTDHDVTPPTLVNTPFCQPVVTDNTGQPGLVITSRTTEPALFTLSYGTTSGIWDGQLASTTDLDYNQTARLDNLLASTTYFFQYQLFDASANATTTEIYNCNTLEPMVAKSVADALEIQLIGKVPEDEVGQRLASSSAIMLDESVPVDPSDATSTLWVQLARQGWMSITRATSWVLASSTEALLGMVQETAIIDRIASTSQGYVGDATSTAWVEKARELWVSEEAAKAQAEAAKAAGTAAGQASSGGGGMIIIDKTDKVAPVISEIKVTELTATSARVSWLTNEASSGFIKYGIDANYGKYAGFADLFISHFFVLENLEPQTTYHFNVQGTDGSGNLTTSSDNIFTTLISREGAIIDPLGSSTVFVAEEQLNVDTMKNAASKIMELLGQFSKVVSINTLESQVLSQFNALQEFANMIPAPVLSGEPNVVTTPTTATIRWSTDKKANSLVAYTPETLFVKSKNDSAYIQVVGQSKEDVTSHNVKIYNLKPETVYHFQLRSQGNVGPDAKSRDFTFKTKPDALEIISFNSETLSPEKAQFNWLTSLEADTQITYTPYRAGKLSQDELKTISNKALSVNHEMVLNELESGAVYQVELASTDKKGIKVSNIVNFFSTTKYDLPPTIDNIQTESALSQGKDLKVQTAISWTTNEPTACSLKYAKGSTQEEVDLKEETPAEASYSRKHALVITKFELGSVYSFRIYCTDSGDNQTASEPHVILTPKQRDSVFDLIINTMEQTFGWLGKLKR